MSKLLEQLIPKADRRQVRDRRKTLRPRGRRVSDLDAADLLSGIAWPPGAVVVDPQLSRSEDAVTIH